MSGPQEMHISFQHHGTDYNIDLVKGKPSDHSVEINGVTYAVLGEQEKLETACKILSSVSLDSITSEKDLQGRLSLLEDISFPQAKKTNRVGIDVLGTSIEERIDVQSAKEAYLLATDNPHDAHVAVGILRPDGSISELNLGKNEAYGAHRIGSVTKTFTAFLALKLMNDGMINLETSLGDLIDKKLIDERVLQGVFADPTKARQMTLEQLLSHTSGLEGDDKPRIGPEGEDDPNVRLLTLNERFIYQATLDEKYEHKHKPGEGIGLYSNLGFDVAAWM